MECTGTRRESLGQRRALFRVSDGGASSPLVLAHVANRVTTVNKTFPPLRITLALQEPRTVNLSQHTFSLHHPSCRDWAKVPDTGLVIPDFVRPLVAEELNDMPGEWGEVDDEGVERRILPFPE
mmetsp:Transcript_16913/g.49256  ORF Transcript_16913/g.49256 Transcript_16913/m.49256 type:complete len:124 (-) Transcript_16913:1050-1421(-)